MLFDRKSAFWVTSTLLVCTFVIFIILAVMVTPTVDLTPADIEAGSGAEYLVGVIQDLSNMVWWMTVGFVMLPIMLLLLVLAIFFLLTLDGNGGSMVAKIPGLPGARTLEVEDAEPAAPHEVWGLEHARGEATREQHDEKEKDLKKTRL